MSEFEAKPPERTTGETLDSMSRYEMHRAACTRSLDGDYGPLLAYEALNELVVLRSMGQSAREREDVTSMSEGLLISDFTIAAQAELRNARTEDRHVTYEEYRSAKNKIRLTPPPETWQYDHEGGDQRFAGEIKSEAALLAEYWGEGERLPPDFQMQLLYIAEQQIKMDKIKRVF